MGDFYMRLAAAKDEMSNPVKDNKATVQHKSGGTHSYNYEDLEQVISIVRPALRNHDLDFSQRIIYGEDMEHRLVTSIIDCSDGTEHIMDSRKAPLTGMAQQDGSWETYMRRYSLKTLFCLAGADDDGEAASKPRERKNAQVQGNEPENALEAATDPSNARLEPLREALRKCSARTKESTNALTAEICTMTGVDTPRDMSDASIKASIAYLNQKGAENG